MGDGVFSATSSLCRSFSGETVAVVDWEVGGAKVEAGGRFGAGKRVEGVEEAAEARSFMSSSSASRILF